MTGYACIVADPPWPMKAGPLRGREGFLDAKGASRPLAYPTMSVEEIAALPVADVAADHAHLYLWAPNRYLRDAFDVARAWGFSYSTTLVWSKRVMGGGLGGCYGISTEFVLFCRRGTLRATGKVKGTAFTWKRPYDERGKPRHSAKPTEFFDMVEQVSPGPRLELFARDIRPGWDVWGNEVDGVDLFGEPAPAIELPVAEDPEEAAA
jgi:N6-adenosine-specific RNA methylase IME4